ncbi:hemolysin family protein [Cytophagales bacterium LB-30]|uniref:Hemolysin family protein n=1 Tax=Shiella aurantiaca TaxID=3058365 RepID=A0ABT8F5T9_9BACT|nr:hemolysin family protein [Shiella aurantiaca]MDN4165826.1 hemolysin family protein [Shiella aurantiaca]
MSLDYYSLLIIFITLVFSAFFSGIEIAFVSANKLQIELENKQGLLSGRLLSRFLKKPSDFLGTTLVGNTIALVVYGIFMAKLLDPFIARQLPESLNNEASVLILSTILSTLLVLITAEFTPKSVFLINPNFSLSLFAVPLVMVYYLMYPLVQIIVGLSKFTIKNLFRLEYSEDRPVFRLADLNVYIDHVSQDSEESANEVNTKIFSNALEFKTVKVRDCMIPRTDIVAIDIEDGIDALKKALIESGHSKIIVYNESIDEVIGYCHSLALYKKPKEIQQILTPIIIVPETMLANELMVQFIQERKSLALVVDEFGGTSGLVSIEDIFEEIFGDIQDEHDEDEWIEQQLDENTYLFSARHEIDYLNDTYGWEIPEGDYETLGGYILSITENIPAVNEVVEASPFIFTIQTMQDTRIDTVKVTYDRGGSDE